MSEQRFAAVVTVTVRAVDGMEAAASLLRDVAYQIKHGRCVGAEEFAGIGDFEFSTLFDVAAHVEEHHRSTR